MRKKEERAKERDEEKFAKETKLGLIFVGVAILLIVLQVIFNIFSSGEEKKPTASIEPTQNVETILVETATSAALSAVEETTVREVDEHNETHKIQIKVSNKEVLTLLNINEKKLEKTITDFTKEYGYEYADAAIYYGQTIINHNDNTVTCSFALDNGEEDMTDAIKFDLIYARDSKTYRCVMW